MLNEKMFLLIFCFFIFAAQLLLIFSSKKIVFRDSPIQRIIGLLFVALLASTLFSKNAFLSLWGRPGQADSLIVIISCLVIFFSASALKRRDTLKVLEFFISGSAILAILFLVHRFIAVPMRLFDSVSSPAIIMSIALVVLISFVFNNLNYFRVGTSYNIGKVASAGVFFLLFFVSLLIIDMKLSWFFVSIGVFFIFWRSLLESDFKFKRKKAVFSLSLLLLFLALFFIPHFFGPNFSDVKLSYESSWNIAEKTLTHDVKQFFVGSGLGTYSYQFALYKDKALNAINHSIVFDQGAIPLLTFFTTVGFLGALLFLFAIFFFFYQGFKYFLDFKRERGDHTVNVRDVLFPVVFCLSLLMFFYKIDVVSLMLFFFALGLWDGQQKGEERMIELSNYSKMMAKISFSLAIIILGFVIFNYLNYYRAEYYYQKSVDNFQAGGALSESLVNMEKASSIWKSSDYQIGLSQLYLIKASDDFKQKWTTTDKKAEQKASVRENGSKAEEKAKVATNMDSNNFQAWQNLGLVYENTNLLLEDRTSEAIAAYNIAETLAPQNYDIYVSKGRVYEKMKDKASALKEYAKAFQLNPLDSDLEAKMKALRQIFQIIPFGLLYRYERPTEPARPWCLA